jgi:tRNA-uridine 2-sulfurtransferase
MKAKKQRVCIGMSGGVDSSVAAHLIKKEGYDVVGLTFRGWPQDCRSIEEDKCCGPQAVMDARMVAHALDIPYYVIDEIDMFQREVMDYFAAEYKQGRTPNPCVICNEKVKFGSLLRKARALGAEYIATGHYARITTADLNHREHRGQGEGNNRYELRKSRDSKKDQTYFLFSLNQEQLARAMFPLGDLTKEETRAIAKEIGLKTYGKEESQEVCFVPDNDYRRFLRESAHVPDQQGEIVTRDGKVLGHHNGIHNFTIGQREGLNLGGQPHPLYVIELNPQTNRVIVGPAEELLRSEFEASDCIWHCDQSAEPMEVTVKPRHQHPGCKAVVERRDIEPVRVKLCEPQRAIAPGQAAVFYRDDVVVGGGWIR